MTSETTDRALAKSIDLLRRNRLPEGYVASSAEPHYAAIWARDGLIAAIGATLTGDPDLTATAGQTVLTLAALQAPNGAIPNAYWPARRYWDWGEAGCVDGAALLVIAAWHVYRATGDAAFAARVRPNLVRAVDWLRALDVTNQGLVTSPEASDWMDSTLNRSGKVLYVNVLYAWAARCLAGLAAAFDRPIEIDPLGIAERINAVFWPGDPAAYNRLIAAPFPPGADRRFPHPASAAAHRAAIGPRRHYAAHVTYARVIDACDVLANDLAILTGIAGPVRARTILDYLAEVRIAEPYPVRVWPEPEDPGRPRWGMLKPEREQFQGAAWRNPPHCYHNGAVWPFAGGFHVAALAAQGEPSARDRLVDLARANQRGRSGEWEFREWLHGRTGEPAGAAGQTWNAAAYVIADRAVRGEWPELPTD